ncbi:MAG: hypothetical protein LBN99_04505 [Oscillospiraceae bacterium]|jgi:hypothetical protein|nr:hypothetical protein [Oscillospiraceae bacterium]
MPDYKAMYYALFNSVTDAIEAFKKAQLEAEEAYMNADEPPILFISAEDSEKADR